MRAIGLVLGALVLSLGAPARAADPLAAGLARTGASATLLLGAEVFADDLAATRCRICTAPAFDDWVRTELRWHEPDDAKRLSNVTAATLGAAALGRALLVDDRREGLEVALAGAEAATHALLLGDVLKLATGRRRPYVTTPAADLRGDADEVMSLWSNHAAATFALATATAVAARERGDEAWGWWLGGGLALATATSWLRVAGDRHWATDIATGALAGSAIGVATALWLYPVHGGPDAAADQAWRIVAAPGGLAVRF